VTRLYVLLIAIAAVLCLVAALAPMLQSTVSSPPDKPGNPPGVRIIIDSEPVTIVREAEAGTVVPPMQVFDDPAASGGKYVMTPEPPTENLATGGRVEFALDIPAAGDYKLWLRVEFDDSCDNSLEAGFGGAPIEVTNNNYGAWQWIKVGRVPFHLQAGPARLIVGNRENGSRLDQVLVAQDLEYVPVVIEASR
jgi:hypothetical protein